MNKSEKCSRGSVIVAAITRLLKLGTQAKSKRKRIPAIQPQAEKPALTVTMTPPRVGENINRPQPQQQQPNNQQISANNQQVSANNGVNMPAKRTPKDYIFGKVIGDGSFSTVYIAKDIHSNKEVAIKVCDKLHIIREKKTEYVKREKEVLNIISSSNATTAPFFTKLHCTFQDNNRLYFVLTYAKNGELLPHINKVGSFDIACTRFYAAEILRALEHIHSLGIIHRDLKPENILLDDRMHILVTDFGSSKILHDADDAVPRGDGEEAHRTQRRNSFVGTAQYVSPELLTDKSASKSSDLWALGCIIYQMVSGLPPFRSRSEYAIFKKILKLEYEFPDGFSPSARDLVEKLLVLDPTRRLGANDAEGYPSIRAHPFFRGVDFDSLYKQTPPQIYPYLPGTSENEELRSQYRVPDHLEPGLDDRQLTRLLGLDLQDPTSVEAVEAVLPPPRKRACITDINADELTRMLECQREGKWNALVEGNLILKQGLVDKRKGLFARRRMLLLTLGPHLYYVDPVNMVLKGEIPWSPELRVEPKSFKIFFVHTPNRTYYLEDPDRYALEWCKAIEEVRIHTYGLSS